MFLLTAAAASIALVAALGLTPLAREFARRIGAVDSPGGRRVHARATPRMGGLAVVAAHLAGMVALLAWDAGHRHVAPMFQSGPFVGFLAGGIVITLVGAIDDVHPIGAKRKLAGQILAASIAWGAGARIEGFDLPWLGAVDFGFFASYVLTVAWVLAFVNAVNLIDGLDGLASGIVLFVVATNTIVALATGNVLAALINGALAGALLGFLKYNFNPATVFLGDTGSLYLGYAIGGAALLSGRQKESTLIALLVPIVALGVPLTDTLFTMVRRFLERRPIFAADRGHIHHRLLDLGLTHRRVVMVLYGLTVLTCALALVAAFGKNWVVGGAIALAGGVVMGGAAFAGYFRSLLRHERAPLSREAEALRRAVPEVLDRSGAPGWVALCERIESQMLPDAGFVYADLVAGAEIVWQAGEDSMRSKDDVEYWFSWEHDDLNHRLRFFHRGSQAERCDRIDVLLMLVADRVRLELVSRPQRRPAPAPVPSLGEAEVAELRS